MIESKAFFSKPLKRVDTVSIVVLGYDAARQNHVASAASPGSKLRI